MVAEFHHEQKLFQNSFIKGSLTRKETSILRLGVGWGGVGGGGGAVGGCDTSWENSVILSKNFGLFGNILERIKNNFCRFESIGQFLLFFTKFILFI